MKSLKDIEFKFIPDVNYAKNAGKDKYPVMYKEQTLIDRNKEFTEIREYLTSTKNGYPILFGLCANHIRYKNKDFSSTALHSGKNKTFYTGDDYVSTSRDRFTLKFLYEKCYYYNIFTCEIIKLRNHIDMYYPEYSPQCDKPKPKPKPENYNSYMVRCNTISQAQRVVKDWNNGQKYYGYSSEDGDAIYMCVLGYQVSPAHFKFKQYGTQYCVWLQWGETINVKKQAVVTRDAKKHKYENITPEAHFATTYDDYFVKFKNVINDKNPFKQKTQNVSTTKLPISKPDEMTQMTQINWQETPETWKEYINGKPYLSFKDFMKHEYSNSAKVDNNKQPKLLSTDVESLWNCEPTKEPALVDNPDNW
jgi:hypothetical protein